MYKFISIFIFILATLSACQNKPRVPNQISPLTLMDLIQEDQNQVTQPLHASQSEHYDGSRRPVVLILHGLHESPYFMKHWVDFFARNQYQVISMRLPGHFEKNEKALSQVTAEQWIEKTEQFFSTIIQKHPQISILGYSTGGTLATYLALNYPQNINQLFLISPALTLSDSVFLSGLTLGQTSITGHETCQDPNNFLCKVIKNVDSQAEQMLVDGLPLSPQAGRQVQRLIEISYKLESKNENYYESVLNQLLTIDIPVSIADTELDNVVNIRTNQEWMKRRKMTDHYLLFKKNENILHTQMARGPLTPFSTGAVRFNPKIKKIESLFQKGL